MIKYRLAQALKDEQRKTRKRILKWIVVALSVLYVAINLTCAYPFLGWHPHACLCDICLEQFESERR